MGLDFSAASMVVFVELPQEVALVRQAEDRAHRHGQRNPVNVYFLMAKGTCDERRWVFCHWYCRRQSMALGGATARAAPASAPSEGKLRGAASIAWCSDVYLSYDSEATSILGQATVGAPRQPCVHFLTVSTAAWIALFAGPLRWRLLSPSLDKVTAVHHQHCSCVILP